MKMITLNHSNVCVRVHVCMCIFVYYVIFYRYIITFNSLLLLNISKILNGQNNPFSQKIYAKDRDKFNVVKCKND